MSKRRQNRSSPLRPTSCHGRVVSQNFLARDSPCGDRKYLKFANGTYELVPDTDTQMLLYIVALHGNMSQLITENDSAMVVAEGEQRRRVAADGQSIVVLVSMNHGLDG